MCGFPPLFIIALVAIIILRLFVTLPQMIIWLSGIAVFLAALGNTLRVYDAPQEPDASFRLKFSNLTKRSFPGVTDSDGTAHGSVISGLPVSTRLRIFKIGRGCIWLGFGVAIGMCCLSRLQQHERAAFSFTDLNRILAVTGIVAKDSSGTPGGKITWELDLESIDTPAGRFAARGRVRIFYNQLLRYYQGERLYIKGRLNRATALPGISFLASARDVMRCGFRNRVAQWRMQVRQQLDAAIDRIGYPAGELFRGLFLGEKEYFPVTLSLGFSQTGTMHLLALSGMHVGILFGLLCLLLMPFPRCLGPVKGGVISAVLLFYLWLTGMAPSLCRATIMLILTWAGVFFKKRTTPLANLGLALLIILFSDPSAAFSVGLQLSFLAMAGIILFFPGISRFMAPYFPSWLSLPLASSLAAQITTFPVVLLIFGAYYPVNILVTMLLVPLITVYMWAGLIMLCMFCLSPLVKILSPSFWFTGWAEILDVCRWQINGLYHIILAINNFFSACPGFLINNETWALKIGILGYGLLVFSWLIKKRRKLIRPVFIQAAVNSIKESDFE